MEGKVRTRLADRPYNDPLQSSELTSTSAANTLALSLSRIIIQRQVCQQRIKS